MTVRILHFSYWYDTIHQIFIGGAMRIILLLLLLLSSFSVVADIDINMSTIDNTELKKQGVCFNEVYELAQNEFSRERVIAPIVSALLISNSPCVVRDVLKAAATKRRGK